MSTPIDPAVFARSIATLPPPARVVLERLLREIVARGGHLPKAMLADLRAISVEGVDAKWQVKQLQKIMDRWLRSH
jgi:hypothetical protein